MMESTLLVGVKTSASTFGKLITTIPNSHLLEGIEMVTGKGLKVRFFEVE